MGLVLGDLAGDQWVVSLTQNKRVGQGGETGVLVDWTTAGEIKTAQRSQPTVLAPRPVGDRTVHDGQPDEQENHHGAQSGSLASRADHQNGGGGGEHALEQTEQDVWHGRDNGGSAEHLHQTEVQQVAQEGRAGGVGEDERVAPEEPLERGKTGGHDGRPQKRQRVLFSTEARVQQPNARNHNPHQSRRDTNPDHVRWLELFVQVGGERVTAGAYTGEISPVDG